MTHATGIREQRADFSTSLVFALATRARNRLVVSAWSAELCPER